MSEGLKALGSQTEHDFKAPSPETDKLYMAIGDKDVIEVAHPSAPQDSTNIRYLFINSDILECFLILAFY